MPSYHDLTPAAFWREIRPTAEDRAALDPATGLTMLAQMHLIRAFEEKVLELAARTCPVHFSIAEGLEEVLEVVW